MKYLLLALLFSACAAPAVKPDPAQRVTDSVAQRMTENEFRSSQGLPLNPNADSVKRYNGLAGSMPPIDTPQLYIELYLYGMDLRGQLSVARANGQVKRANAVQKEYNKIVRRLDSLKTGIE